MKDKYYKILKEPPQCLPLFGHYLKYVGYIRRVGYESAGGAMLRMGNNFYLQYPYGCLEEIINMTEKEIEEHNKTQMLVNILLDRE